MATVIHDDDPKIVREYREVGETTDSGVGGIIAIIIAIIVLAIILFYALPLLRGTGASGGNVNVNLNPPAGNTGQTGQ